MMDNYRQVKAFSNFFPGVAGLYGTPMWAFYVNRGQAISSFGIESKDKAILEFQPANKAYRLASTQGFRTFLKISDGKAQKFYEPFCSKPCMAITSHDLTIAEADAASGVKVTVNYFTMPEEPYAALVRRVTIENISRKDLSVECIDGLPVINPYGLKDWMAKNMSRTVEAWAAVHNVGRKAPFYQLKVEVADTPQVKHIDEGNFYFAFDEGSGKLLNPVVEAACVFGQATDFLVPEAFYGTKSFVLPAKQQTSNRTACAMAHIKFSLKPGKSKTFTAMAGFAHDLGELNGVVRKAVKPGYVNAKALRNRAIIDDIKGYCFTHSASTEFSQYCGQNFLDNVLRGGLPVTLKTEKGQETLNIYSRKHGDPERDYNFFMLAPTFLSQGNGNYRDVNQNRRNDVWFNQNVGDSAIVKFLSLVQADGYNPLIIKGQAEAEFGEGYWSDHWTYNLDLIESYLRLYPENLKSLLLEKKAFRFYLSGAYVLPREKRYVVTPDGVRQYHSLAEGDAKGHQLLVKSGVGDAYQTTLAAKLLCLLANKAATLDPSGIGIEMEANKPNWYDALNGLPGLLGSSINETFELKRLACFVKDAFGRLRLDDHMTVDVFNELADFIQGLSHLFSTEHHPLEYWKKSNDLKEHYRHLVRWGIEGPERKLSIGELKKFLDGIIRMTGDGIERSRNAQGLFPSYFYHEVTKYDVLDKSSHGEHHARPLQFKRHDLPYFLEGFVHALRVNGEEGAGQLYRAVKKSALYDKELKMYRINADLSKESEEIGRTRIFPPGWLENGSIWLHMEYKYLLELLRRGLHAEFFTEARTCLVPFMDPARYGRSILENSSFIVSSVHEDKNLHGQGFVARLSGSTAEFIHMWLLMSAGLNPFGLDKRGRLTLAFKPVLPAWLFTKKASGGFPAGTYAFKFLNSTLVVYYNPKHRDTFGPKAASPVQMTLRYTGRKKPVEVDGGLLAGDAALDVRNGKVERIDVFLG